jgi:4-amino-4-deoxy-L-arabinose transferase-like glycosyltransferase
LIRLIKDKLFIGIKRDELVLFSFFTVYLVSWTLFASILPLSTEIDSTEQVVWSEHMEWCYYKHPPLPSLLLHVLNALFGGPSIGLTAFAAQSCNVVALIYVWLLAKQMLSKKRAIVAVLLTSLIAYHNFRALTFNHNTVSMPFLAAALYYFYTSLKYPQRTSTWLALGIACVLAMLTKYSALLVFGSFFVFIAWQRLWSNTHIIRGLTISSGVFTLLLLPHIVWLTENNWLPFHYLHDKLVESGGRMSILVGFVADQLIRLSLMLPLLLGVWYLKTKGHIKVIPIINTSEQFKVKYDLHFLLAVQVTPLILALIPTLLTGSLLNSNWVSAFFLPAGILITKCCFHRLDETLLLKSANSLAWVTHAVIMMVFFFVGVIYPSATGRAVRLNFPGQTLTDKVTEIWHEHQKEPLTLIISDTWTGGNILLHARPEPSLLIDNSTEKSPWLSRRDEGACGAFILAIQSEIAVNPYALLFNQASATGDFYLPWGHSPQGKVLHYIWAIKAPLPGESACKFTAL